MRNILLIISLILYPIVGEAQSLSQWEKVVISSIISTYVPDIYNNRFTPCLLDEIYNKLEERNGLTEKDSMLIIKLKNAPIRDNENIEAHKDFFELIGKIVKLSNDVLKNSSCYVK